MSLFHFNNMSSSTIIAKYSWAWVYFVSYNFFEASIIMNVIVGVIVNAVNDSRQEIEKEENNTPQQVTLEYLSKQIEELKKQLSSSQKEN